MTIAESRPGVLRIGDRILFNGAEHQVVGIAGNRVRLHSPSGPDAVVLLPHLLVSPGFVLLDSGRLPGLASLGLLEGLAGEVVADARSWERHVVEVETGLPPGAPQATVPKPDYDPTRR